MKGLILKDLYTLKSYWKTFAIISVIFIFMAMMNAGFTGFLTVWVPFFTVMMCLSTFTYDEYNNWELYAAALPLRKKDIVKSKYCLSIGTLLLSTIVVLAISIIATIMQGNETAIVERLFTAVGTLFGVALITAILYPLIYKFGAEKGRIYLFVVIIILGLIGFGLYMLLRNVIPISFVEGFSGFFDSFGIPILLLATALIQYGSYRLSIHFFKKREI